MLTFELRAIEPYTDSRLTGLLAMFRRLAKLPEFQRVNWLEAIGHIADGRADQLERYSTGIAPHPILYRLSASLETCPCGCGSTQHHQEY